MVGEKTKCDFESYATRSTFETIGKGWMLMHSGLFFFILVMSDDGL